MGGARLGSLSRTAYFLTQAPIPRFHRLARHRTQFQNAAPVLSQDPYRDRALWKSLLVTGHNSTLATAAAWSHASALLPASLDMRASLASLPGVPLLRCSLGAGGQQAPNLTTCLSYPIPGESSQDASLSPASPGYFAYKGDPVLPPPPYTLVLLRTNFWENPKSERPTDTFCFKS